MVDPERSAAEDASTDGRPLAGHVAEWEELVAGLHEHVGLTVLAADPLSGTSLLLDVALKQSGERHVLVDARVCGGARDIAMAIADAAVGAMAREALAWWQGVGPPGSAGGLRLRRMLRDNGIDSEDLRNGTGQAPVLVRRALDLAAELATGHVVLAVDHLGSMLSNIREGPAREILDALRSGLQRNRDLALVLVDQPHGPIVRALRDRHHWQRLRRIDATCVRQQWDQLRRIHPAAQMLVAATSVDIRPHSVPAASKTVDDGLNRLRDVGVAWQPQERTWAVADPLLAAFAREHVPPWAVRRLRGGAARAGLDI
jgi:hypothetical protein